MAKAKGMSGGKRGSVMTTVKGRKNTTFTAYTGNIVQSAKMSGLKKGAKPARPGRTT